MRYFILLLLFAAMSLLALVLILTSPAKADTQCYPGVYYMVSSGVVFSKEIHEDCTTTVGQSFLLEDKARDKANNINQNLPQRI